MCVCVCERERGCQKQKKMEGTRIKKMTVKLVFPGDLNFLFPRKLECTESGCYLMSISMHWTVYLHRMFTAVHPDKLSKH